MTPWTSNHIAKLLSNEVEAIIYLSLVADNKEHFKHLLMAYTRVIEKCKKWPDTEYLPIDAIIESFESDLLQVVSAFDKKSNCCCTQSFSSEFRKGYFQVDTEQ